MKPTNFIFEESEGIDLAVSSEGKHVIIGANRNHLNNSSACLVGVYKLENRQWTQIGDYLTSDEPGNHFGYKVAISPMGNRVAISAPGFRDNLGLVRVFEYKNDEWQPLGNDIIGKGAGSFLGTNISLCNNEKLIAISGGLSGEFNSSAVYELVNGFWEQKGRNFHRHEIVSLSNDGSQIEVSTVFEPDNQVYRKEVKTFVWKNEDWEEVVNFCQ